MAAGLIGCRALGGVRGGARSRDRVSRGFVAGRPARAGLLTFISLVILLAAPGIGLAADTVTTCLVPCHSAPGLFGPDVATIYLGVEGGHKLDRNPRVVEDASGATLPAGSKMPCTECHTIHQGANPNIYMFSSARTGGTITTVRQLCVGCHRTSDSALPAPVVAGLILKKLPPGASDHASASSRACTDCHGATGHEPQPHGGGGGSGCGDTGCHGSTGSHAIHLSASDPRGPAIADCDTCHLTDFFPTFADGQDLAGTAVCDECHSPGGDYDGVESTTTAGGGVSIGAKDNWDSKVYETTSTLQVGKERWCAGCHDGDPAVLGQEPSLIDGVYAPPVIGDEDGGYAYGTGWGYYQTGHGLAGDRTYPSSGGLFSGAGLDCDGCHDFGSGHIDGDARTFDDGDNPDTPASVYRLGYRLELVGGQEPMQLPWPINTMPNNADRYRLCASCHATGRFTDSANRDTNAVTNDGTTNIHNTHLSNNQLRFRPDWSGGDSSRMSCPLCHDVHGSKRLAMVRDGRLIGREPGIRIWYHNPDIVTYDSAYQPDPDNPTPPEPDDLGLSASTGILWVSGTVNNLCLTNCHDINFIRPEYRNAIPWWPGEYPLLTWTYEPDYMNRGVFPDRLLVWGSTADFRVKYYDREDDPPVNLRLMVDIDDSGSYEASETFTLDEDNPLDLEYWDGKVYGKTLALDNAGDGTLSYQFVASDGVDDAVGPPTWDHDVILDANHKRDVPSEYPTIQDAIDDSIDGDVISVADGTYQESLDFKGKNVTVESVNGPAAAAVVGDGSNGPVVTFDSGEDSGAVLDGFRVDNQASPDSATRAVYIDNSSPTISDCVLAGNGTNTESAYGGAVHITGAAGGATIVGTTIGGTPAGGNSASRGGALFFAGSATGVLTIDGCTITYNSSTSTEGGALRFENDTNPTLITDTTLAYNTSNQDGGAIYCSNASISVSGSHVDNNTALSNEGGGISLTGASTVAQIASSTIDGNSGVTHGGGIWATGISELALTSSSVDGNQVATGSGGGINFNGGTLSLSKVYVRGNSSATHGGGVYVNATTAASITNCVISGNRTSSNDGGGVYGLAALLNTTIAGNRCGANGGGVFGNGPVTNSVIWGNEADTSGPAFHDNLTGSGTVAYSDVDETGYAGTSGNIREDPGFEDPRSPFDAPTTQGSYDIEMLSPCMDAADDASAPADDIHDLGRPQGHACDMGADEVAVPPGSPYLLWTQEPGYADDGVDPDDGSTGSNFTFRVDYRDDENDPPSAVTLWVDLDNGGDYQPGEATVMAAVEPSDLEYRDGKRYTATLALTRTGDGVLDYRFTSSDGTNDAIGEPVLGSIVTVNENSNRYVPSVEYPTIQDGIDAALPGEHVVVADGYYYEDITFSGKEITVESVNGRGSTYICGTGADTRVVSFTSGETTTSVLEGFTIDNTAGGVWQSRGVYISNSSPTIEGCALEGNSVNASTDGGAVYITGATSGATIVDTTIGASGNWNTARNGAGIYCANSTSGNLVIDGCTFTGNNGTTTGNGGAMYVSSVTNPVTITDTEFAGNSSGYGAGIYAANATITMTGGSIHDNTSTYDGVGMRLAGATTSASLTGVTVTGNSGRAGGLLYMNPTSGGTLDIADCTITGNSSLTGDGATVWCNRPTTVTSTTIDGNNAGARGGGLYVYGSAASLTVTGGAITNNTSGNNGSNGHGAGIYFGGATAGVLSIDGTTITGNSGYSGNGGGIYIATVTNTSTIANATISGNSDSFAGGGIYCTAAPIDITGSHVDGNSVTNTNNDGGGIYMTGAASRVELTGTSVNGNTARNGAGIAVYGGADLYVTGGGTSVSGNYYSNSAGFGGGIAVDGSGSTATIERATIAGNWAGSYGGGIRVGNSGTVSLTNSSITGNVADQQSYSDGGGVYNGATTTAINCTIAGNLAGRNGGGWQGGGTIRNCILWDNVVGGSGQQVNGTPTVTNSDVDQAGYGLGDGSPDANGNMRKDPEFDTPAQAGWGVPNGGGDFHLEATSPVAGMASATYAPDDDIDGDSRPQGLADDMGSDEILGGGSGGASIQLPEFDASAPVKEGSDPVVHAVRGQEVAAGGLEPALVAGRVPVRGSTPAEEAETFALLGVALLGAGGALANAGGPVRKLIETGVQAPATLDAAAAVRRLAARASAGNAPRDADAAAVRLPVAASGLAAALRGVLATFRALIARLLGHS